MTNRKKLVTEMGRIGREEFRASQKMPLVVVLDNVRSLHNVGSVFRTSDAFGGGCWYECEVCGTRTEEKPMPWIAEKAWNNGELIPGQFSLF